MREIKFQAWDKKSEVMLPVEQWARQSWVAVPIQVGEDEWELNQLRMGDIELMQYTGLKDKNGKDCYEGDKIIPDGSEITRVVEFRDGCFTQSNSFPTSPLPKVFKIIGNIYENKG